MNTGLKGQSGTDLIIIVAVLFFVAFLGMIISKIWNSINSGIQTTGINSNALAASSTAGTGFSSGFNIAIIVGLALIYMGLFITSYNLQTEPMFFFINVFLLVLALGFSAIMANVFDSTNTNDFVTERAAMPATVFVMGHLLEFSVLAVVIILIGLFAKSRSDGF